MIWRKDEFYITDDRARVDIDVVHGFLSQAYWCRGITCENVVNSLDNSINFSVFHQGKQVGFARVISDMATIAYLGDVFVLEAFRGRGISKFLMQCVKAHPKLQNLRRWILATSDAHSLYQQYGFTQLARPELFMECHNKDVYLKTQR